MESSDPPRNLIFLPTDLDPHSEGATNLLLTRRLTFISVLKQGEKESGRIDFPSWKMDFTPSFCPSFRVEKKVSSELVAELVAS